MRVALVCPPADRSPLAAAVFRLLGPLREHHEVELFLPETPARAQDARSVEILDGRSFERMLFPIANDPAFAFALPWLARHGGTAWMADWELADLACAAYPALRRGGARAFLCALREGGLAEARRLASRPAGAPLALNRSVVRRADAFLVHDEALRERIRLERNAPTPIGVLPPLAELSEDPSGGARLLAELLAAAPTHRSGQKSLIASAIEGADAARRDREAGGG